MILIVGLGNPSKKYAKTRHNIGFRVIDVLAEEISDKNIILLKPDRFMNNSGRAVNKALKYSSLKTQDLIVIHDDIDLPLGTIRISKNSSSGGHKGVQSIIDALGSKDFIRIRIGIRSKERPAASFASGRARQNENLLAGFVLQNFAAEEEIMLQKIIKKATEIIKDFLENGLRKTTVKIG